MLNEGVYDEKALLTDDECWLRVQARDASADGRFVLQCEPLAFLPPFLSLEAGVT
ncbi:hypothetical protein MYA98_06140 [Salmonella sp. WGH-01]|nr:hypothetical protein MYA98_06140 [Salmonella sp. WGH-01]